MLLRTSSPPPVVGKGYHWRAPVTVAHQIMPLNLTGQITQPYTWATDQTMHRIIGTVSQLCTCCLFVVFSFFYI